MHSLVSCCTIPTVLLPPPFRAEVARGFYGRWALLTSWLGSSHQTELRTGHQIPHGQRTGSCWLARTWPNAPAISLIFRVLRTAASGNQWDLSIISIYRGTTRMPCCHGFPSLLMEWKETKNRTLSSGPLSAAGRLEASLNRMEMTSWILIIYPCTFLYLLIAWIFHLVLKIFIWNCQWSKTGKQNRAGCDFLFFSFFWKKLGVRIILVYADFTRWSQSKRYILKLHRRR